MMMMMMMMMMMQPQQQIQIHTPKKPYTYKCHNTIMPMIAMMMLTMMIAAWINWQCVTLTDFSKHGQVDFYKAADSISDYLTSIFPRLSDHL